MSRLPLVLLCLAAASAPALAQDTSLGSCAVPDSIAVRGNQHTDEATIRGDAGLIAGASLNFRDIQRAVRAVFATGQYDDVQIECVSGTGRAILAISVKERPVLAGVRVQGVDRVSSKAVRERIEIPEARPLKRAIQRFIEDPLSEKILVGDFSKGDDIEVDVSADKSKLDFRVLTSSTKA